MKTTLAKGTRGWIGSHSFLLEAPAEVDFENVPSTDGLAEVLSTNTLAYSLNRDSLAHEEEVTRPVLDDAGKPTGKTETVTVHVSYGVAGSRVEQAPDHVAAQAEAQAKNVAEADAAAKAAAAEDVKKKA